MKVGIIGAGKWGQALYSALSLNNEIFIYNRSKKNIKNFISLNEILDLEYLIISIPSSKIYSWLKNNFINKNQKILVASKGIDPQSGKFLNQIYSEFIKEKNLAFISGPSFSIEVEKKLPTAIVINSTNLELAKTFASIFPNFIKTYISDDVIGAEIAGAYKNVIAIASGICEGLKLGNNAKASLISRGLVEMCRFGEIFGAKISTFYGLSGAGDLFLTASSTMSRNFRLGIGLANEKSLEKVLKEINEVVEGIATANAIHKISQEKDIYLPIAKEVYLILNGKNPKESLKDLLK